MDESDDEDEAENINEVPIVGQLRVSSSANGDIECHRHILPGCAWHSWCQKDGKSSEKGKESQKGSLAAESD